MKTYGELGAVRQRGCSAEEEESVGLAPCVVSVVCELQGRKRAQELDQSCFLIACWHARLITPVLFICLFYLNKSFKLN
jgi:hypothetical protein